MNKFSLFFSLLLLCPLLISCGGSDSDDSSSQNEEAPGSSSFEVTVDSDLSPDERAALENGINFLETSQIDGSSIRGFNEVFKGNQSSNVVNYLNARVNNIVSVTTDTNSRVIIPAATFEHYVEFIGRNPSQDIWYKDQYYNDAGGVNYLISGNSLPVDSTYIGVIQLGESFTSAAGPALQAITLVHEARHSDCPEGALRSDIVRYVETGAIRRADTCGQLHTGCVARSCDGGPWGPYAIDYIYSLAISEGCSSCSITEKQEALINANQVQSAAFDIEGTLNGNYGLPNMNNSTQVTEDL